MLGRPLIALDQAPKFHFQNERAQGSVATDLHTLIKQDSISTSSKIQLDSELNDLVNVCNLLATLVTARDFLLVTGGNPDENLLSRMSRLSLR